MCLGKLLRFTDGWLPGGHCYEIIFICAAVKPS
uniref:Uncharacterized protein n=1 Tax=Anguilla anguilla TaxID=7936 RepID=A0A0E9PHY8_ANGAN